LARAKRTERAEARRRYRAATAVDAEGDEGLEAPAVPAAALPRDARAPRPAAQEAAAPPARPGFLGALRSAAGPVDIKGDIKALPSVLVRSKAGWVPAVVILGTTVAMMIPGLASNEFVSLAGNVILQPPPMIIAFLAGMLAPRGAWLLGGIMATLAGIAWAIVVTATTNVLITPLGFPYDVTTDQKLAYAGNVLLTAPIFGIAVGAFAGFYRRFLNMSSPQRQAAGRRR
jgi:hypothetical protein